MLIVSSPILDGQQVDEYLGLVGGEAIIGTNFLRDFFAGITDIVGGRSATYEKGLRKGKALAIEEMEQEAQRLGATAILSVDIAYHPIQKMLMVTATGTAVVLSRSDQADGQARRQIMDSGPNYCPSCSPDRSQHYTRPELLNCPTCNTPLEPLT